MRLTFKIKGLFLLIGYILIPIEASAGIFSPPLTDRSIEYLGKIFGGNIGGIQLGADVGASGFFGNLFQSLNGIVLSIAVVILSYSSILSVVNTAQDGEVMGKKWSSVWIPLRSAIGLLLLAPIPGSGYSLIQVTIMWIVLNGVGAADLIWNLIVDHLAKSAQFTTTVSVPTNVFLQQQASQLAKSMLRSTVCNKIFEKNLDRDVFVIMQANMSSTFVEDEINGPTASGSLKFGANSNQYSRMKNVCGQINIKVTYDNAMDSVINNINDRVKISIVKTAYEIKKTALQSLLNSTASLANNMVEALPASINIGRLNENELRALLDPYFKLNGLLANGILGYVNLINNLNPEQLAIKVGADLKLSNQANLSSGYVATSKAIGWILAGSYYYNFSKFSTISNLLATALYEDPALIAATTEGLVNNSNGSVVYDNSIHPNLGASNPLTQQTFNVFSKVFTDNALSNLTQVPEKIGQLSGGQGILTKSPVEALGALFAINPPAAAIFTLMYSVVQATIDDLFNIQYDNQDPLLVIAARGAELMRVAEVCWIVISVGMMIGSAFAGVMAACSPGFLTLVSALVAMLPVLIGILGIGWTIGVVMSIYMPLIPFMIFAMTALSWIIAVIESIVAGPIVALGLISPSQDELGAIKPALEMLANIFIKPTLIVIGLLFSTKLFKVCIAMINEGFKNTTDILNKAAGDSFFSWIGILGLFCGFVIALEHKCYSMIHHLPDTIMSWIGVKGEATDTKAIEGAKATLTDTTGKFKQDSEKSVGGNIANFTSKMNKYNKES